MRNFLNFLLLILIVGAYSKKNVKRRSLVSRFTSNPFFLSHFNRYDDGYFPEITYGAPHSDGYKQVEHQFNFGIDNTIVKEKEQKSVSNNAKEETTTMKTNQPERIIPVREEIKEEEPTQTNEEQIGDLIFNSLPHFDRKKLFYVKKPNFQDGETDRTSSFTFKSVPLFDPATNFRQSSELNDVKDGGGITFVFNSLPHFDVAQKFDGPRNDETVRLASLPDSEISQKFHDTDDGDQIEETVLFNSLPHFHVPNFSNQAKPNGRKVVKIVRRRKLLPQSEEINGKKIESIADLPLENFDVISGSPFDSFGGLL